MYYLTAPLVPQKVPEPCKCRVCRSDLVNIVPCEFKDAIDFTVEYTKEEISEIQKELSCLD
jgi:hypothetical protein